jgi:predicted secreted Zn-dependent protease
MINSIGKSAGDIYQTLNKSGGMTISKLKTKLGADPFTFNAAIGWLARENKVEIQKVRNSVKVNLKN